MTPPETDLEELASLKNLTRLQLDFHVSARGSPSSRQSCRNARFPIDESPRHNDPPPERDWFTIAGVPVLASLARVQILRMMIGDL